MAGIPITEKNQDATLYVANIDEKVNESLLWDLFIQTGQVVNVHILKDKVTQKHQGAAFVEFQNVEDAEYTFHILNFIKLYDKPIKLSPANSHKQKNLEVGANLFIGHLDPDTDEKLLFDTFSSFGTILNVPKILSVDGVSAYAFINYASFEASDAAKENMNGQYLFNKIIKVDYAFKKDNKCERHGTAAERMLAAQNPHSHAVMPHQSFATAAPIMTHVGGLHMAPFPVTNSMVPPQSLPLPGVRMPLPPMMYHPPGHAPMMPHPGSLLPPPAPPSFGQFPSLVAPMTTVPAGWRPPSMLPPLPNGMMPPPPNGMMPPPPTGMMPPPPNGVMPPPPIGLMPPPPIGLMPPLPPPPSSLLPPPPPPQL